VDGFDQRVRRLSNERRELLELWLAGDQGDVAGGDRAAYAPPTSWEEQALAAIWQEILEVDGIGIDDDYFHLGGDSILAIVVVARAQAAGLAVTTQDLFELRTVRRLAEAAKPTSGEAPRHAVDPEPAPDGPHRYPLTPMQQGMLFHALDDPAGTAYVVQVSCRLDGDLVPDQLVVACQALVDRHPVLRTSFHWHDGQPYQVVHPVAALPVEVLDLRSLPAGEQQARIDAYLADDRRRGFELTRPPLLRVALLRLSDSAGVFVFTHHHLLMDGWSQQIVLRELLENYDSPGCAATADPPPFAAYLDWLAARDLDSAESFWREQLADFAPTLAGQPHAPGRTARYATVDASVPAGSWTGLIDFARRHGLTPGTVLYGGWALLLSRLTGASDVGFGVTVSGRPADLLGVTDTPGMFINTLPLRVPVRPDEPVVRWLGDLQRRRSQLERFQHTPLTLVARCLPDRAVRRLFDTIAVVENFPQLVVEGQASRRLRISAVRADIEEGYPLVFEARTRSPVRLRLRYDADQMGHRLADELRAELVAYVRLFGSVCDEAGPSLAQVMADMATASDAAGDASGARRRATDTRRLLMAQRQPAVGVLPTQGGTP
jgi:hypothetical protein